MFKKILTILFIFTVSVSNTIAYAWKLDITTIIENRDNNTILTKSWYSFTDNLVKWNFYYNQATLKQVKTDLDKIKKLVWWREDLYYLILWMLKTESNITPVWWIKAWDYFKANWDWVYKWLYFKCKDNLKLPIWAWRVSSSNKWFDISKSLYNNYKGNRQGWFSQAIAYCEFRAVLPTQEEKNFLDNWKTSYVGAIWLFQFLPLNITKKLWLDKDYKQWDIFTVSWYAKAIYRFLQYNNYNYSFDNPEELEVCENFNSRKYAKCKDLRERIYWYNHSTNYINTVIKNAVELWKFDRAWIIASPVNNVIIYPKNSNVIIKINNIPTKITQAFHFSRNRWHPAFDIVPDLWIKTRQNKLDFINRNKVEIIWNSNKEANCYFIPEKLNKNNWFIKRTWNTVVCITKDSKYVALFAHLKWFNKDILKKWFVYNKNHNIIAWYMNWMLNYPWIYNFKKFKYYKFNWLVKVKNIKIWDVLWYMWNEGHSTWPHLHWVYVKNLWNKIQVLSKEFLYYLNKIKLFNH